MGLLDHKTAVITGANSGIGLATNRNGELETRLLVSKPRPNWSRRGNCIAEGGGAWPTL